MNKRTFFKIFGVFSVIALVGLGYRYSSDQEDIDMINNILSEQPSAAGIKPEFKRFDATQFSGTHAWLGDKLEIVYQNQIINSSDNTNFAPDETLVKQNLRKYTGNPRVVFLMQNWGITVDGKLDPMAAKHAEWYKLLLAWTREILPNSNVGIVFSTSDLMNGGLPLLFPIIAGSDAIYLTFDVAYNDNDKLLKNMADSLFIAKSFSKPVYPVMWHRWSGTALVNKILPAEITELQCKFVRKHADGLVWWSGANEAWEGGVWYPAARECFS